MRTQASNVYRSTRFIAKDKETWVPAQNIKMRKSQFQYKTQTNYETKGQDTKETYTRGRFQHPARLVCTRPEHVLLSQYALIADLSISSLFCQKLCSYLYPSHLTRNCCFSFRVRCLMIRSTSYLGAEASALTGPGLICVLEGNLSSEFSNQGARREVWTVMKPEGAKEI